MTKYFYLLRKSMNKLFIYRNKLIDLKKFLFFFYIAVLYILFSDPQKRQWWGYSVEYTPQIICYELPQCFRLFSLNLLNISSYFLDIFLKILKIKINNIYFIPHYFFASLSLTYVFFVIKKIISSDFLFFFIISYIFAVNRIFQVPVLFLYDYLVLAYIFLIIDSFQYLERNFFSKKSIFLLLIGCTIFEYLGFLYFGTIMVYNFFRHKFSNILFQIKHLFLIIFPFITVSLIYLLISLNPDFGWTDAKNKTIFKLWEDYGQFNNFVDILISLIKYSFILIFTSFIILAFKIKSKNKITIFSNNKSKILLSLLLVFLFIVLLGRFTSGFSVEWQRQFLPILFISSSLSCLLIKKIFLFTKKNF